MKFLLDSPFYFHYAFTFILTPINKVILRGNNWFTLEAKGGERNRPWEEGEERQHWQKRRLSCKCLYEQVQHGEDRDCDENVRKK